MAADWLAAPAALSGANDMVADDCARYQDKASEF
jgi:hypothetical protein